MRLSAYLSPSRHGIFYFRWPLPPDLHPAGKWSDVKVSLGTRCPEAVRRLARRLALAGQRQTTEASLQRIRYDEIREHVREHFRHLRQDTQARIASDGPMTPERLDAALLQRSVEGFTA
ncbi:DUF6538 domain-containing protein [Defluviimonas sp. SAOS-178_SWC]|uniref:DUF6538 domain-containing protein n=1 Tax=Defluviimonas sp. SAOS-178_SWC TaxID=3121287 RepID=UPI003D80A917